MTNFMRKRFSVSAPINDAYADNYERTFGKKVAEIDEHDHIVLHESEDREEPMRFGPPGVLIPILGLPKISIARAELEKWIERLEAFQVEHRHRDVSFVVESMKLILKADRITDPEARKK